jgi:hypothetical protein
MNGEKKNKNRCSSLFFKEEVNLKSQIQNPKSSDAVLIGWKFSKTKLRFSFGCNKNQGKQ